MAANGFNNWNPPAPLTSVVDDVTAHRVLVGVDESERIIAAVTLLNDGTVKRLAVSPEHQGTGIGAAMTKAIEEQARQDGHADIKLDALASNSALIRFYERAGYSTQFEHEREGWRFARMTKSLTAK